jgi:hypothetical protein
MFCQKYSHRSYKHYVLYSENSRLNIWIQDTNL